LPHTRLIPILDNLIHSIRQWFRFLMIIIGCLPLSFSAFAELPPGRKADAIAGYLINIPRLVEWPDPKSKIVIKPFLICVLGAEKEIYKSLTRLSNQSIHERPVKLAIYHDIRHINSCNLLFISDSEQLVLGEIFSQLKTQPILTISDIPGFIHSGGAFELKLESKKISILANPVCARKHNLFISSSLLALTSNKSQLSELNC
jgi:hypothetical protein